MKKDIYKAKPGEMEIRILKNGTVFMAVPDERLIQIARTLNPDNNSLPPIDDTQEIKNHDRC